MKTMITVSENERITVARLLEDVRDAKWDNIDSATLSERWLRIIREANGDLSAYRDLLKEIKVARRIKVAAPHDPKD